jgi:hypothetical protein
LKLTARNELIQTMKKLSENFYTTILLIISLFSVPHITFGQEDSTSGKFKPYVDKLNKFSFSIPIEWEIIKQEELPDMAFPVKRHPTDNINYEKEIFTIEIWPEGVCDSTFLRGQGFSNFFPDHLTKDWSSEQGIASNGNLYFVNYQCNWNANAQMINDKPVAIYPYLKDTIDLRQIAFTDTLFSIKGKNWTGYWCKDDCGVLALNSTSVRGEICESIYFSDGKHCIIQLLTNGNQLEDKVRKKIFESFKFF